MSTLTQLKADSKADKAIEVRGKVDHYKGREFIISELNLEEFSDLAKIQIQNRIQELG